MKRPPGLWLLLSAGVLWLSVQNVYGIKATSLIFGKPSTTTAPDAASEEGANSDPESGEVVTTTTESVNSTSKPSNLTGIPQIDYVWDPNLPRELNGYNLSEYPFYDRVPEEIDFKCDGLHDGFYASVPHKCQVYHHCLFGTRYDFLCANYTAFDQKTFICHFVSEVDCVNSKKFWHRNDALYQAASTTTIKPTFVYTPPAQPPPFFANAATSASNLQPQPQPPPPVVDVSQSAQPQPQPQPQIPPQIPPRRNNGGRQRPRTRPRRPQYDYYDDYEDYYEADYYEEPRPRGRRKRPRPRPRPLYDDEYDDEYEVGRRRRPGRRPYRGYDDRRPMRRRNKNGDRRPYDDLEDEYEDEPPRYNRRNENRNKNGNEEGTRINNKKNARPTEEDTSDDNERPRKGFRRPPPADDYYEDEKPAKEEKRSSDRRRNNNDDDKKVSVEDAPLIKPTGVSSIYNRPRTAPKIRPPVPKNEQEKFAYKTMPTTEQSPITKDASLEDEYYEDYEEEPPAKKPTSALVNRKPENPEPRRPFFKQSASGRDEVKDNTDQKASRPRGYSPKRPQDDEEEEVERPNFRRPFKRPKYAADKDGRYSSSNRNRPLLVDEYYDEEEDEKLLAKNKSKKSKDVPIESTTSVGTTSTTTTVAPTTTTTTVSPLTTVSPKDRHEGVVRVVKRPFLPSRGGNPYVSRGLQPIGTKAAEHENHNVEVSTPFISVKTDTSEELPLEYEEEEFEDEEELLEKEVSPEHKASTTTTIAPREQKRTEVPFKPSPVLLKVNVNVRSKSTTTATPHAVTEEANEAEIKSVSPRLPPFKTLIKSEPKSPTVEPKTTEKPKSAQPNPLEYINENEYDVTLNEALNPTLPNLPIRAFPTGFSSTSDSQFRNLHRNGPRYVVEGLAQESTDYTYQVKQPAPRQRFDAIPIYNSGGGAQFVNSNADYQGQFSQISSSYHRPTARITQAQTRGFYHGI